jgi:uncharacterized protein
VQGYLFDTSAWLAAIYEKHAFHTQAVRALEQATAKEPAVFCRATQQSVLRLTTTAAMAKAYQAPALTNRQALQTLDTLQAFPQVRLQSEPLGIFEKWRLLSELNSASPKVWMDAYLAAFAITSGLRMVTLDKDFKNFVPQGLDLSLLQP